MTDLLPNDLRDFDDAVPGAKSYWHGSMVVVTAQLVPRYLWTTASIDVFLDGQCILRTGGQMKLVGSSSAEFLHDGDVHEVELSWGRAQHLGLCFPYDLTMDGAKVSASEVQVANSALVILPLLVLVLASLFISGLLLSVL